MSTHKKIVIALFVAWAVICVFVPNFVDNSMLMSVFLICCGLYGGSNADKWATKIEDKYFQEQE